jgi:hypothetical protein
MQNPCNYLYTSVGRGVTDVLEFPPTSYLHLKVSSFPPGAAFTFEWNLNEDPFHLLVGYLWLWVGGGERSELST